MAKAEATKAETAKAKAAKAEAAKAEAGVAKAAKKQAPAGNGQEVSPSHPPGESLDASPEPVVTIRIGDEEALVLD